jgi:hypothetical protein
MYFHGEIDMTKSESERPSSRVPDAPKPSAETPKDGMKVGRELARRYLPNAVRSYAAIAFAPDSEAALHTKVLAINGLVTLAGGIPQAIPAPPPPHDEGDGGGEPS